MLTAAMLFTALAFLTVLLHFCFILFVVFGGFAVARRPRLAPLHLACAAWGAYVSLAHRICPLTPLENWLRRQGGGMSYRGDFLEHYLLAVVYPSGLTAGIQNALGLAVIVLNAAVYAWIVKSRRARARVGRGPRARVDDLFPPRNPRSPMKKKTLAVAAFVLCAAPLIAADEPYGSLPVAPSAASAPAADVSGEPQPWGTTTYTAVTLSTWGFSPLGDGNWNHFSATGWSSRAAAGNTTTCADLHLPTGARLAFITTFTNDTDATGGSDITVTLHDFQVVDSTHLVPFTFSTTGAPGVQRVLRSITPAVVVEGTHAYVVCIAHGAVGAGNQSAGATLWYQLQVSAAPAVATFPNDVPTSHPFFRFVEAMAASGLTGGCGTGAFCPDAPVTRGQLSVFLASALGLHFPN